MKRISRTTRTIGGLIVAFNLVACSNKTDIPEPTLEAACPQVKTTQTKIVNSNFPASRESDLEITITGELTYDNEGLLKASATLIDMARSPKRPNIRIYVASEGGHVHQGFALKDTVEYYDPDKILMVCTTMASSAASFMFATKAKRYALPSCEIVTHAVSVNIPSTIPKKERMRMNAEAEREREMEQKTNQMRELYKNSFNLTDACANYLTRKYNTFLSAYDALKLRFFDAVLEPNGRMTIRDTQSNANLILPLHLNKFL